MSATRPDWSPDDNGERADYGMVWRFVDQSSSFALGVEAGIIYERMARREVTIATTVHVENDEELHNLANSFGYHVHLEPIEDYREWLQATFTRQ